MYLPDAAVVASKYFNHRTEMADSFFYELCKHPDIHTPTQHYARLPPPQNLGKENLLTKLHLQCTLNTRGSVYRSYDKGHKH